ncbi:unnamed protein product [Clavelina lepadiformis]|uniref:Uncharacterized protein n=1 Tax=Clavelina lepadiformis TaxID=159417 RepID=A0ABP0GM11_CLALP
MSVKHYHIFITTLLHTETSNVKIFCSINGSYRAQGLSLLQNYAISDLPENFPVNNALSLTIRAMVAKQKRGDLIKNRSKNISRLGQDLITQALQPNPQKRPFIKTLLDHRWLYENKQSTTSSMTQSSNAEVKVE